MNSCLSVSVGVINLIAAVSIIIMDFLALFRLVSAILLCFCLSRAETKHKPGRGRGSMWW